MQLQPLWQKCCGNLALASKRKTTILSFTYKLSHNLTDFSIAAHLNPNYETRTRRSLTFKFVVPRAKKDIFNLSFFPWTINEWNSLPEDFMNAMLRKDSFNAKLVNSFKFSVDLDYPDFYKYIFHCISFCTYFECWCDISQFLPT